MIKLTSGQLGIIQAAVKGKFPDFKRFEIVGLASRMCGCGETYVKAIVFSPSGVETAEREQTTEICPGCGKIKIAH